MGISWGFDLSKLLKFSDGTWYLSLFAISRTASVSGF